MKFFRLKVPFNASNTFKMFLVPRCADRKPEVPTQFQWTTAALAQGSWMKGKSLSRAMWASAIGLILSLALMQ